MTLAESLQKTALHRSENVAVEFCGVKISFAFLHASAEKIASAFLSHGILKGDCISVFAPPSFELIYSCLACFKMGGILVPVNFQFKEAEALHILLDSGAKAIVTDREHLPMVNSMCERLPLLEKIFLTDGDENEIVSLQKIISTTGDAKVSSSDDEEDIAAIFYTSGTTGKPKGAALSNRNIISNLEALKTYWHWSEEDVLLHTLPLYHVHGLIVALFGSLFVGNKIILKKKFEAEDVLKTIEREEVTLFMGVPTMYYKMMDVNGHFNLSSMRLFISGSAPLSKEVFDHFNQRFGFEILERAGMSETLINFSNRVDEKRILGSVGFPLPGIQVRIVNEQYEDQPANAEGEILLKGENVFKGYWKNELATSQSFHEGWFQTSDIGKVDEEGHVYIVGRKKDVIKSGGILIFPREIEEVISSIPQVRECAVIGIPDMAFGEVVKACIVLSEESLTKEAIVSYCNSYLAPFKKPKCVEFFNSLPRNSMGKVLKEELRNRHTLISA